MHFCLNWDTKIELPYYIMIYAFHKVIITIIRMSSQQLKVPVQTRQGAGNYIKTNKTMSLVVGQDTYKK
jgi:hypothetical protein